MPPQPSRKPKKKPHLYLYEGSWYVGLRGNRREGWRFDTFDHACTFARVVKVLKVS